MLLVDQDVYTKQQLPFNWMWLDGSKTLDFPRGFSTGSSLNKKHITGWWCNNHLEKHEFVNGKDDIPYISIYEMENNPFMFETF